MPRTTEELLKDTDKIATLLDKTNFEGEIINMEISEFTYNWFNKICSEEPSPSEVDVFGKAPDMAYLIAELSAKLRELEWQEIDHDKPEKYQEPGLWGIWVHNNKTDVRFFETHLLYLNEDGGLRCVDIYDDHHSEWDFDSYTHWKPITTTPQKLLI